MSGCGLLPGWHRAGSYECLQDLTTGKIKQQHEAVDTGVSRPRSAVMVSLFSTLRMSSRIRPANKSRCNVPLPRFSSSNAVTCTRKHTRHSPGIKRVNDTLDTDVRSQRQVHGTREHDDDVESHGEVVANHGARPANFEVDSAHAKVGQGPEHETEPAIEERRHDGENCVLSVP